MEDANDSQFKNEESLYDLNEQLKAEAELKTSQQFIKDILQMIPVRVFWKDKNLNYLGCNMIFASDAGFSDPKEIIGKDDFLMGWRDQAEIYRQDDQNVIDSGCSKLLIEELQTTPSGEQITLLTSKVPLKNSDNEILGVLGTYMDITERKQAEYMLEQTRKNYETFFDTIDDFLFVLDESGNIVHVNSTVIKRLGYSKEELYGKSVLTLHPAERRGEVSKIVDDMLKGLEQFCPIPLITKSGIQIPVETKVSQGFWDGKPAIFGVTKDISKLRLSEEKFSKLFRINPSACGLSDLDTLQYIEVNEAFQTLFGYEKHEVIGKTPFELGIFTLEAAKIVLQKADSQGKVSNVEADLKTKSGDIKHVLLSSDNIYIQDKKYRFTLVYDITEKKQTENLINVQNEKLLKMNNEKDKFFSIIAHDLRNPFNNLLGFTRMLVDELPSLRKEEISKIANSMKRSATNLYSLLENLLEWSRMQRGITNFIPESVSLNEFLPEFLEPLGAMAIHKEIEIIMEIPKGMTVYADINMLASTIRNLTSNALKFTPKRGKIKIYARELAQNFIEISIQDSGIGMDENLQKKIFEVSAYNNRKGTEGEVSSGLGLIICKEFIEKHGGSIRVESKVGEGSTFSFTIPAGR